MELKKTRTNSGDIKVIVEFSDENVTSRLARTFCERLRCVFGKYPDVTPRSVFYTTGDSVFIHRVEDCFKKFTGRYDAKEKPFQGGQLGKAKRN